jgi:peptidoglycan/LPS O-acetylase OafA/YrhL
MLPYWPMAIVLALGYTALPALSAGDRTWGWVSTLTLIPTAHPPALSVAWTLQHELAFYLIYAVLHFSGRLWLGLAAWAMLIVAGQFAVLPEWPLLRVVLAPINVEFMAGIAAAQLLLSGRQTGWIWPVLAATLCIGAFVVTGAARDNSWIAGFAIAALLPWLCQQERDGRFSVPGWLVFGGAASYAIYLTHNPLLSVASRGFASLGLDWLGAIVAGAAVCTLFGVIYHLLWEKPVMRLARRGNQPRIRSSPG